MHDDIIKWKHFPCYWPPVRGIHQSQVNFPHRGQWRGARIFSLICAWTNGWVNNQDWLSEQLRLQWFETPSRSLWHHCNGNKKTYLYYTTNNHLVSRRCKEPEHQQPDIWSSLPMIFRFQHQLSWTNLWEKVWQVTSKLLKLKKYKDFFILNLTEYSLITGVPFTETN